MATKSREVKLGKGYRLPRADSVETKNNLTQGASGEGRGCVPPLRGGTTHPLSPTSQMAAAEKKKLTVDDVVALAETLTPAERKEVLARLALSSQRQVGRDRDLDMWADAVYRALASANGGGDGAGVGLVPLRRLLAGDENWAAVCAFMAAARLAELAVTERASVYQMLANMLTEHAQGVARHSSVALSPKFVANCSRSLAAIFDAQFPGYVRNGLARVVAMQYAKGGAA